MVMSNRMDKKMVKATELLESDVYNREHNRLGKVIDLVIDTDGGYTAYVNLDMQKPNMKVTVPWSAFDRVSAKELVLNISEETLRQAAG